jgi:D-glycero-D-manno-heptose 1,7-bisphosphate phosphatase
MNSGDLKIDKTWSLFLDRDGVINQRIIGGYIHSWDQFVFLPGVLDAMKILSGSFGKILVVSNQQGIGKGLMTDEDVWNIHLRMAEEIKNGGGSIDKTYYSPFTEMENSILRKPNIGMALKARKEFPGIIFKQSVMVGDSISDMIFGKRLKMKTVLLSKDNSLIRKSANVIDLVYDDLLSFAKDLPLPRRSGPRNDNTHQLINSSSHQFTSSPPSPITPPSPPSPPSPNTHKK